MIIYDDIEAKLMYPPVGTHPHFQKMYHCIIFIQIKTILQYAKLTARICYTYLQIFLN